MTFLRDFKYRSALLIFFGLLLFSLGAYSAHAAVEISDGSVIGLWHLDSNSNDSSTNAYNGTDTSMSYVTGQLNNAASFSGSGKIDLPNFAIATASIAFWFKGGGAGVRLVSIDQTPGGVGNSMWVDGGGGSPICIAQVPSYSQLCTSANVDGTSWHFVVVTKQANSYSIYVDNSSTITATLGSNTTKGGNSNAFGYDRINNTGYQSGLMDEVAFLDVIITTSTRDALWNSGAGDTICITTGCAGTPSYTPILSSIGQYEANGSTTIAEGATTAGHEIVFKGTLTSTSTNNLDMEIEVEPTSTSFTGIATGSSTAVASGNTVSITVGTDSLFDGNYHWRARAVDNVDHTSSTWTEFGTTGNTDFVLGGRPTGVEISDGSVIGLWHLDGNSSDTTANGYDGTPTDITYPAGIINQVSSFGSSTSKIDLPNFTATDTTLIAWEKTGSPGAPIVHLGNNSPQQMLWLDNDGSGNIRFAESNGGYSDFTTSGTNYGDNNWHLVIGTRSGNTACVYADNVYKGCGTLSPSTTVGGDRNAIGYDRYNNASHFGGSIDEVAVLNAVINTSTRDALWNQGNGKPICLTAGCGNLGFNSLQQYFTDSSTMEIGTSTTENQVKFGAKMQVASGTTAELEVEVEQAGVAFTGTPSFATATSSVASGTTSYATVQLDQNRTYHWQARAKNNFGTVSAWQQFETSTNAIDFRVSSLANAASEYFDGSSSLTYSAASTTFAATDPFTIELWYRTPVTSTIQDFVETRSSSTHKGFLIDRDTNLGIQFLVECDTNLVGFHSAASLTDDSLAGNDKSGIWHYVAVTKGTATSSVNAFKLYFDGAEQSKDSTEYTGPVSGNCFTSSTADLIRIGQSLVSASTTNYLTGNLDEIRIWNTERSAADVSSTWNQEIDSATSGLVELWRFNSSTLELKNNRDFSDKVGAPVAASSTPFGHFILSFGSDTPAVTSTRKIVIYNYDGFNIPSELLTAIHNWNDLGEVLVATTTDSTAATIDATWIYDPFVAWDGQWDPYSSYPTTLTFNQWDTLSSSGWLHVATHELGHALGLGHSYSGNVMIYYNDHSTVIGDQDKSDYHFLWGGE